MWFLIFIANRKPETIRKSVRLIDILVKKHVTSIENKQLKCSLTDAQTNLLSNLIFSVFLIYRFMQQLEDSLNVVLCGHFLILLATMCFAAFSTVTVQQNDFCMLLYKGLACGGV